MTAISESLGIAYKTVANICTQRAHPAMSDPIPAAAAAAAAAIADDEAKRKAESQGESASGSDSDAEEAEGEGENGSDEDGDKEKGDAKSKNVKNSSGANPAAVDPAMEMDLSPPAHRARLAQLGSFAAVVVDPASEGDEAALLSALIELRKLVSVRDNPPHQALLDQPGLLERLIELLGQQYSPELIFESAWVLTNIATGNTRQVRRLVDAGAIPALVELLIIDLSPKTTEQAAWALGNIASDISFIRDSVHEAGALHTMLALLTDESPVGLRRQGSWLIRSMSRGKPLVGWGQVADAFDLLARWYLAEDQDAEVLENVSVALSHMSECANPAALASVLDNNLLPRAMVLLGHPSVEVRQSSLCIFGNLAQGDDVQTQAVVDCGVLPTFVTLLSSPRRDARKEAAHILSNICAGSRRQVQAVLDAQALPDLMRLVANRGESRDIRNEALWAIANAASGGGHAQWQFLVQHGAHRCLYDQLSDLDRGSLGEELMRGLSHLVDILYESDAKAWRKELRDLGVEDHLRLLVDEGNEDIAQAAQDILEKYEDGEEEEEAEEEQQGGQQQQPEQPQEQEAPAVRELEGQMRAARIDEQPGADDGAVQGENENA